MHSSPLPPFRGLAAACTIVMCTLTIQAANRSLDLPLRYRADDVGAVSDVFAADLDGDGKQDLLTVGQGNLNFFKGLGNGKFDDPVFTDVYGFPQGLADFDRDGKLDVYIARYNTGLAVMRGLGNGAFAAEQVIASAWTLYATAGDFNGDTYPDLAGFSESEESVAVHFGNGAGAFTAGPTTSVPGAGDYYRDLGAGDFDGDGKADLFVVAQETSVLAWNNGSGSFPQQEVKAIRDNHTTTAGDVNGDGRVDLVTMSGGVYTNGAVEVFFGTATRLMPTAARFPVGLAGGRVVLAQMDGTGALDIVIGSRDFTVITHDGTNFRAPRAVASQEAPYVAVADFDGDGKKDVVAFSGGTFSIIKGNGDGTLRGEPSFQNMLLFKGTVPAVTDLNGDGRADLLIHNVDQLVVAHANGTGGFSTPIVTPYTISFGVTAAVAGHVDSDGRIDVVLYGLSPDLVTRWQPFLQQANGTFTPGQMHTTNASVRVKAVGDLTGDGRLDILDSAGTLFAGTGNGTFGGGYATGMILGQEVRISDVNNDGRMDVVTRVEDAGTWVPRFLSFVNNANGTFTRRDSTGIWLGLTALADLTGDGFPELFNFLSISRGNGDGTFQTSAFSLPWLEPYISHRPSVADFDGDGLLDAAIPEGIFYGTGDMKFDGVARMPAIAEVVSTADFDGDGSPDVWMADPLGQRIVIVRNQRVPNGTKSPALTMTLGTNPSRYGSSVRPITSVATGQKIAHSGAIVLERDSIIDSIHLPSVDGTLGSYGMHLPIGTSNVTATFTGDSYYAAQSVSKSHTVLKAVPRVNLYATPDDTREKGEPLKVCTAVAPVDYGVNPTGTVTLRRNGTLVTTFEASTVAYCTLPDTLANLPVGTHTFTSEYEGGAYYEAYTATKVVTITRWHAPMTVAVQPGELYAGMSISVTASFPEDPAITGSVKFTRNGYVATVPISNGKAVWTTSFPYGGGDVTAEYSGSVDYEPAVASSAFVVYASGMSTPPVLLLTTYRTPGSTRFVHRFQIPPVSGAIRYDIYQSVNGGPFQVSMQVSQSGAPETSHLVYYQYSLAYTVVAVGNGGVTSPMSARVATTTYLFTDETLSPSIAVKALHLTQLQNAINGYRVAAGLSQITFPAITAGAPISASTITALRNALTPARNAMNRPLTFTDPTIAAGVTPIRAVHLQELRDGVR